MGKSRSCRLVRPVIDLLVLRHQLAVPQRQSTCARFEPEDRAVVSALARVLSRERWSICW
jgi:hypothetical protein